MRQATDAADHRNHMISMTNHLARLTHCSADMTHLQAIETRQRKSAVRDLMFAAFIALAAILSISSVTTALLAASTVAAR